MGESLLIVRGGYLEVAFVADLMVDCLSVGEVSETTETGMAIRGMLVSEQLAKKKIVVQLE